MRKHRKAIFVVLSVILVVGATLGAVAFVQADDQDTPAACGDCTPILERVAAIYEQNTGVTIDSAELEKAFEEAREQQEDERLDNRLQQMVEDGKMTQEQADAYKAWLESRPSTVMSDEYKQWLDSRPEGTPFGMGGRMAPEQGERLPAMPRGFDGMKGFFHR